MQWQNVREQYPDWWVVIEALDAHIEAGRRIVEELSVVNVFSNPDEAMQAYNSLHQRSPQRELYVFHTNNESLDIRARFRAGVRRRVQ